MNLEHERVQATLATEARDERFALTQPEPLAPAVDVDEATGQSLAAPSLGLAFKLADARMKVPVFVAESAALVG